MSDRPDLDEAISILQTGGWKITGGKYAPKPDNHKTGPPRNRIADDIKNDFAHEHVYRCQDCGISVEGSGYLELCASAIVIGRLHEMLERLKLRFQYIGDNPELSCTAIVDDELAKLNNMNEGGDSAKTHRPTN